MRCLRISCHVLHRKWLVQLLGPKHVGLLRENIPYTILEPLYAPSDSVVLLFPTHSEKPHMAGLSKGWPQYTVQS